MNAMRQRGLPGIQRLRGIVQGIREARTDDVLVGRSGDRGAVGILRDRQRDGQVEIRIIGPGAEVPTAPHHRVALRREKRIGWIAGRRGIVAAGRSIEIPKLFVAAIGSFVKDFVIALARVGRLQDVEIERVLDFASRVARRKADIHDHLVVRVGRIDFGECLADNPLVGAHFGKRVAPERRSPRNNLDFRYACAGGRRHGQNRGERQGARTPQTHKSAPEPPARPKKM